MKKLMNSVLIFLPVFTAEASSQTTACTGTGGEGMGQPAMEEQQVRETGCIQIHWAGWELPQANWKTW